MSLMKWTFKTLILASLMFGASSAHAAVWETRNRWSLEYEARFGQFIRDIDLEIFRRPGSPWAGIPTDCADLAYTLRIIFAAQEGLPVRFQGGKGPLSNEINDFDSISDPVKRVRKFIAHVNYYTSTFSLTNDTYPIAINRQSLHPGTLFLHPMGSQQVPLTYRPGHAYYIQDVAENGIIRYLSSTVPAKVRGLDVRNGILFAPMEQTGGYRAWIWPDSNQRPFLSGEQFEMGGWRPKSYRDYNLWGAWQEAIIARISSRPATAQEQFNAQYENILGLVKNRVLAVNEGWKVYLQKYSPGQCMSAKDYDSYSTPTRDQKLQSELQDFEIATSYYAAALGTTPEEVYSRIRFQVIRGKVIDLNQIRRALLTDTALVISEPEHSPEVRWGLEEQGRWPCPERAKSYVGHERLSEDQTGFTN